MGNNFLTGLIAGLVVAVGGALAASAVASNAADARIDVANASAEHFQIAYVATALAWEERARIEREQSALMDLVRAENAQLADHLRSRDARILSLASTVASLEAKFDSSATTIAETGENLYVVSLDESLVLAGGGFVRVYGPITISVEAPRSVLTDLSVAGRFPISVVISELANGELAVHAFTGDPRLTIASIDVTRAAVERGSLLSGLAATLSSPAPWIGAAVGAGACLLLSR